MELRGRSRRPALARLENEERENIQRGDHVRSKSPGGSLTPLGDPPLFLGFLRGVDFFWTARHVFPETLFLIGVLLVLFYALDSWYYRQAGELGAALGGAVEVAVADGGDELGGDLALSGAVGGGEVSDAVFERERLGPRRHQS